MGQKWPPKIGENGQKWAKMGENGQKLAKMSRKWPKKAENGRKGPKMGQKWPKMAKLKKQLENSLKGQKNPSILTVFGPFLDRRSATAMSSREAWAASALKKKTTHRILRDLEVHFEKWRAVPYIVTIAS